MYLERSMKKTRFSRNHPIGATKYTTMGHDEDQASLIRMKRDAHLAQIVLATSERAVYVLFIRLDGLREDSYHFYSGSYNCSATDSEKRRVEIEDAEKAWLNERGKLSDARFEAGLRGVH